MEVEKVVSYKVVFNRITPWNRYLLQILVAA
jgi:hypothetical protein